MTAEKPSITEPDRVIVLDPRQAPFLEGKRDEYRRRAEAECDDPIRSTTDDAYYKLVVLGILFRSNPRQVTIGEAFDELASTDGADKVDVRLLENAFSVIANYNRGELRRVLTRDQKRRLKQQS